MKKSYLFLAEGYEEVEALAVVDVLRRGGVEIQTVSITDAYEVTSAHNVTVKADLTWKELNAEDAECLIFPGGMPGAENLGNFEPLIQLSQAHYDKGLRVAAICAAPALVLRHLKADRKLRLTCYPGFEKYLPDTFAVVEDSVVVDGKVITGKGPGFAVKFGLKVLEQLRSQELAKEVAGGMLL